MVAILSAIAQFVAQRPVATSIFTIVVATIARFLQRGYSHRKFLRELPGPPHSWLWGHLALMGEFTNKLQPGSYPHHAMTEIAYKYNLPAIWYLDLWPISYSMVFIRDPELADRLHSSRGLEQHITAAEFIEPYFGENVIAVSNGQVWKGLHTSFAPGLSWSSIRNLTGVMFAELAIFRERIGKFAEDGGVLSLETEVEKALFDINGRTIFNEHLKCQTEGTPLLTDMTTVMDQLERHTDIANQLNPIRRLKLLWQLPRLKSKIETSIRQTIQSRLEALLDREELPSRSNPDSLLDAALRVQVQKDMEEDGTLRRTRKLPESEMRLLTANLQGLIAGATGTTRDTFSYTMMMLSKAPEVTEKIRSEISSVLGTSFDVISNTAISSPETLQQLPYTEAVIYEVLRLFPSSLIVKYAKDPNQTLEWEGRQHPVGNDLMITEALTDMGYNEKFFTDAQAFRPERWLDEKDKLPRSYVRAFGRPPRACMGRNMGMNMLYVLIASTIFDFDFECHNMKPNSTSRLSYTSLDKLYGERAFQAQGMSAKAPEGMMMTVKRRQQ